MYSFGERFQRFPRYNLRSSNAIVVIMMLLYILLECIVVGSCISPQTNETYVAKLTYIGSDNTEYFYSNTINQLNVRVGYFSTCIQIQTQENTGDWKCGRNETALLLNDSNFNSSSAPDLDLKNFFKNTAYMFRHDCMSPYLLVVAIVLSFLTIVSFALTSSGDLGISYLLATLLTFAAFSLSLVAAVWQETNTLTGTKLMGKMVDDYYSLKTHYGTGARVLIWFGVTLSGIGFISFLIMTVRDFYRAAQNGPYYDDYKS